MSLYLDATSTDPYFNLATEEYLLKNAQFSQTDIFMLWQNSPTVVIGKHQNAYQEINSQFTKDNNIHIVRRLTGGGAVYHDFGNLNFTFIKRNAAFGECSFRDFSHVVISALAKLGITAAFSGRNDIVIDGRKISGNAQHSSVHGLIHHGTLLINSDFNMLVKCLQVKKQKYLSKGIKSVQSRVANIQEFTACPLTVDVVKNLLIETIHLQQPLKKFTLSETNLSEIEELAAKRYRTWEWNYGAAPKYNFQQEMRFAGGSVNVYLQVEEGLITGCGIFGDFFAKKDIEDIRCQIVNVRHTKASLIDFFAAIDVQDYFYNISFEEIVKVFSP